MQFAYMKSYSLINQRKSILEYTSPSLWEYCQKIYWNKGEVPTRRAIQKWKQAILFLLRSTTRRFVKFPISGGIVPLRLLEFKYKSSKLARFQIVAVIKPSKWFSVLFQISNLYGNGSCEINSRQKELFKFCQRTNFRRKITHKGVVFNIQYFQLGPVADNIYNFILI